MRTFKDYKISTKLTLGFALLLALMAVMTYVGIARLSDLKVQVDDIVHVNNVELEIVQGMRGHFLRMGMSSRDFLVKSELSDLSQELQHFETLHSEFMQLQARLTRMLAARAQRTEMESAVVARVAQSYAPSIESMRKVATLVTDGQMGAASKLMRTETVRLSQETEGALEALISLYQNRSKQEDELAGRAYKSASSAMLMVSLLTFSMAILVGVLVTRAVTRPLRLLSRRVADLAEGDLDAPIPFQTLPNEVGDIARAITVLQGVYIKMEGERWIKANIASLSAKLQEASNFTELSQILITALSPLLNAGHGVFFIHDEEKRRLRMLGSYAYKTRKNLAQHFALGEGLVGQCALEKAPIIISGAPADYVEITSGLGSSPPTNIIVQPVIVNDRVLAVIELASFQRFTEAEQALLDGVVPMLGLNLEILERNTRTQQLLEATQRQADLMAQQAATLEEQKARLQEQSDEMQAQQARLQEAESWFRGIIEAAPDGLLVMDAQGLIILSNPQLDTMFGYAPGELLGKPIEVLVPSALRDDHVAMRANYLQEGRTRNMGRGDSELFGQRRDGSVFSVEVGLSRLPALGGEGYCACASVRDISARKEAEEVVRRALDAAQLAQRQLRDLTDALPLAVFQMSMTADGLRHYHFIGNRVEQVLGVNVAELMADPEQRWRTTHPDDVAKAREDVDEIAVRVRAGETNVSNERVCRVQLHGETRWVLATAYAAPLQADGTVVWNGYYQDVTEAELADRALREAKQAAEAISGQLVESEQRLDMAIRGANTGLWDWRAPTHEFITNDVWAEMLGYTKEELDEQYGATFSRWISLAHMDDAVRVGSLLEQHMSGETEEFRVELRMRTKSGDWKWVVCIGRGFERDEYGIAERMVGIQMDIDNAKRLEVELRHATAVAEEATRMKSDFLANMSHEIRTPMNAIIGMSHLVLKSDLNTKQRDYVRKIQQSGQHLLGIINDILDFSKVEAGKLKIEATTFELSKVLDNLANLIGEKATAKGLELVFDVAADVPQQLIGDPLRLGQILINYANNAVKFTDKGEIGVIVRVREQVDGAVLLYFGVHDTGIGLNDEEMGRLFQSFSQADTSITRKYGGTGLGLAISKSLAELMQGEVGVESRVGQGSTFWFTARLGVAANKPPLLPGYDLRGLRVLVVDDNDSARMALNDMLSAMTFVVDEAVSGSEAIDAVRRSAMNGLPYDIVFMDWQMPGVDGCEAARQIRQLGLEKTPHLIMVTAYGREEVLQQAHAVGIEHTLIKPVNQSLLFDVAMRVLGGQQLDEQPLQGNSATALEAQLARLRGARILVVEDNEMNQQVANDLLTDVGMLVDIAADGQMALDKLAQAQYDLVLMDMQMPVMDGPTATLAIRAQARFADLPIVAMTANAMQADRERCMEVGMNDHVAKPIDPDELWRALLKWLKKPAAPASATPSTAGAEVDPPLPVDIAGLDVALGLRRVLGKKGNYLKMLRKFTESQQDAADRFSTAVQEGRWHDAELIAHTVKSVCGNIGASDLQALAGELELLCRDQLPVSALTDKAQALQSGLAVLIAAILAHLQATTAGAAALPDKAACAALVDALCALLGDDDPAAAGFLDQHAPLLEAALGEQFPVVARHIRQYDFEEGLAAVRAGWQAFHGR